MHPLVEDSLKHVNLNIEADFRYIHLKYIIFSFPMVFILSQLDIY